MKRSGFSGTYKGFKKPTKPMNRVGKVAKKTNKAVANWKKTIEPNHQGYYECYMCLKWIDYLEAEHVNSKVRRPDQRTDPNNLKPTCSECNAKKGSKNGTDN